MNKIRSTSVEALHSLNDLGSRQSEVLSVIIKDGPLCNLHIATRLKKPINQITPRTNELVALGLVEELFRDIVAETGRRAIFWNITDKARGLIK